MKAGKSRLNFTIDMETSTEKIWRVVDLLKWSKEYLVARGVESPQIEAEWMLRHVLNCSRMDIYLNHERPLNAGELATFKTLLINRVKGIPVQYLLGYTEFMGHTFTVSSAVLIPRPETELLVEKALALLNHANNRELSVLDVGTGSGCIAISIAIGCHHCRITALDISSAALLLAKKNAESNNVSDKIRFLEMDILNYFPENLLFDMIVSNPPYVGGIYWDNLSDLVRQNEPQLALYPGEDELIFYRRLAHLAKTQLSKSGYLITEIGGTYQQAGVCRVFLDIGLKIVETIKDYSGQDRIVIAGHS